MSLDECIKYISDWYFSDTVELLDLVLDDDVVDPQYSAITTLNRLWVYLQYKKKTDRSVAVFLPYSRRWDIHQRILICLERRRRRNAKFILPTYWIRSFLKPNKQI